MSDKDRDPVQDGERTATDEMGDRYRDGARIHPANNDPSDSEPTGLPTGVKDSDKSPVAPV
jgi:hypothetical protein